MFTLKIETDNAAFEEGGTKGEIARILKELSFRLENHLTASGGNVRDINGNIVGRWELT